MVYDYLLLCICCYAAYLGAPALTVVIIATLLTAPNFSKVRGEGVLTVRVVAHSLNALLFSALAYVIGRGIALILGA
jgi:hypothetical protein